MSRLRATCLLAFTLVAAFAFPLHAQTQQTVTFPPIGQIPGTTTNDDAAAGKVGEYAISIGTGGTSTVTITNASPGVVSYTAHGLSSAAVVNFTTTGGGTLPGQLVAGTNYYVCATGLTANAFSVATSVDNALAGTCINTTAGSGTVTAQGWALLSTVTAANVIGISLTAGDWDISGIVNYITGSGTTTSSTQCSLSTTSATRNTAVDHLGIVGPQAASSGQASGCLIGPVRFSLSATGTVYAVVFASFSASTLTAYGAVRARRVR